MTNLTFGPLSFPQGLGLNVQLSNPAVTNPLPEATQGLKAITQLITIPKATSQKISNTSGVVNQERGIKIKYVFHNITKSCQVSNFSGPYTWLGRRSTT
jgi:hypothetical protein